MYVTLDVAGIGIDFPKANPSSSSDAVFYTEQAYEGYVVNAVNSVLGIPLNNINVAYTRYNLRLSWVRVSRTVKLATCFLPEKLREHAGPPLAL